MHVIVFLKLGIVEDSMSLVGHLHLSPIVYIMSYIWL